MTGYVNVPLGIILNYLEIIYKQYVNHAKTIGQFVLEVVKYKSEKTIGEKIFFLTKYYYAIIIKKIV